MKEFFLHTKFRDASRELIQSINDILYEYAQQGYDLVRYLASGDQIRMRG